MYGTFHPVLQTYAPSEHAFLPFPRHPSPNFHLFLSFFNSLPQRWMYCFPITFLFLILYPFFFFIFLFISNHSFHLLVVETYAYVYTNSSLIDARHNKGMIVIYIIESFWALFYYLTRTTSTNVCACGWYMREHIPVTYAFVNPRDNQNVL